MRKLLLIVGLIAVVGVVLMAMRSRRSDLTVSDWDDAASDMASQASASATEAAASVTDAITDATQA
jgi:FtsZ-interacting cell division protein ZipA